MQFKITHLVAQAVAALALVGGAHAGVASSSSAGKAPAGKAPQERAEPKETNIFDQIWGLATLYKNDSNSFIQELAITGRYHGQYYYADGPETDDDWDNRRFRIGGRAVLFDKTIELKAEIFSDLNSGGDFYKGFADLNLTYKPTSDLTITVGKQRPRFGWEYSVNTRVLPTFERGLLTNAFRPDFATGVSIAGNAGKLSWYFGGFSNQMDETFGDFNGGWSAAASLGYDLKDMLGGDKAMVRLDYIHSDKNKMDTVWNRFENGVSLSLESKNGPVGLAVEALAGLDGADSYGLLLLPTYDISEKLQLVGRYQLVSSDGELSPTRRYESKTNAGKGDLYNAFYLGFSYFIYDHRLKLMSGVEFSTMDGGDDVWTYLAGVRVYW